MLTIQQKSAFFERLEKKIQEYNLLSHPFYQLWQEGKLDQEILREYAKQYYAHVKAFPTYISAVHSNCPEIKVRQVLLENLMDEERGEKNHPALWNQFLRGLGVPLEETKNYELLPETQQSIATLKKLCQEEKYLRGVAALYAYESQVPQVAKSKREGLRDFYNIQDKDTVAYFSVHEEADLVHRQQEKEILMEECSSEEDFDQAIEAAGEAAKAMWHFLDGIQRAYVTCSC